MSIAISTNARREGGPRIAVETKETKTMRETSTTSSGVMRIGVVLFALLLAALLISAASAKADYGITGFFARFHDSAGAPMSQAASHPDLTVQFSVNSATSTRGEQVDDGQTRNLIIDLPKGFYGNPQAAPQCPREILVGAAESFCPPDTQVGLLTLEPPGGALTVPLYNVAPGFNEAAAFGADVLGSPIGIVSTVTSAHGAPVIRTTLTNVSQSLHYLTSKVVLWGIPSDPAHNAERDGGLPAGSSRTAFLTMPSDCTQPLIAHLRASSWQEPDHFVEATDVEPAPTGCEKLQLEHAISVQPAEHRASTPSAFDIGLNVPQSEAADGLGTPPLRRVQVNFPTGVTLSSAAANGLEGCSDAQLGLGSDAKATCPDASQIGEVAIDTPLLAKDLTGFVYVGTSTSQWMFRVFLVVEGPGVLLKIPGTVQADASTGRLTAVFDQLPDLPFSAMQMHLKGGPGAPLSTPSCGTLTTTSELTAWSGQVSTSSSTMTIDQECDQGAKFQPTLEAGLTNPVAGGSSAFSLTLKRPSGQQAISGLDVTLPLGVLAHIGSVPVCPDAQAAAGTCSSASQIGTTSVGAGDGSAPTYVPQPGKPPTAVYLAGPYKGAPYSLSVVVPAQAGPYDLGTVVVRAALQVNPLTTQVTVESDPIPTILKGVPLRIQAINVNVDRPGFIVAPTNCEPMKVTSTVTSVEGAVAHPSSRFQVGNCAVLGFKPSLALSMAGSTTRTGHPALTAVLTAPAGEANIAKTSVLLPPTEFIDNAHIKNPCTRVQFNANACPAGSILGTAVAYTPLLDKPLEGPVYFRSNGGERELPDLVADLNGQIHVVLVGFIDSVQKKGSESSRVRTRFQSIPDAPVSKFVLKLKGGKKGLLQNNTDLCRAANQANVQMVGQNGADHNFSSAIKSSCLQKNKKQK
jgi:hypothetical protein